MILLHSADMTSLATSYHSNIVQLIHVGLTIFQKSCGTIRMRRRDCRNGVLTPATLSCPPGRWLTLTYTSVSWDVLYDMGNHKPAGRLKFLFEGFVG